MIRHDGILRIFPFTRDKGFWAFLSDWEALRSNEEALKNGRLLDFEM